MDGVESFAWPAAVVLLGLAFMLIFRCPITGLLNRTRKLSRIGLETLEPHQSPAPPDRPDPLTQFADAFNTPFVRDREAAVLEDLKQRGITDPVALQKALLRSLAAAVILLGFEQIENSIWASQVTLLTSLSTMSGVLPLSEARELYHHGSQRFPTLYQGYSFDSWLRFLQSWDLCQRQEDSLILTTAGREFLKWRIDARRTGPFHG